MSVKHNQNTTAGNVWNVSEDNLSSQTAVKFYNTSTDIYESMSEKETDETKIEDQDADDWKGTNWGPRCRWLKRYIFRLVTTPMEGVSGGNGVSEIKRKPHYHVWCLLLSGAPNEGLSF